MKGRGFRTKQKRILFFCAKSIFSLQRKHVIHYACLRVCLPHSRYLWLCSDRFGSQTALIPCVFGVLFLIFGLLGRKESLRKHVMHAAVLIALLAFLGTARALPHLPELFNGTAEKPAAIITQSLNAGFSILYIILAVRSFIQARRARFS